MSEEPLEQPQVFGGYLLLAALGRGAMGDVFLARPLSPGRGIPTPVVVKRLHGELANKPGFVARFRHEAAVAVCVDSKHVAQVYDVGAVGETLYIAIEYVPGWPLSRVLDSVLKSGRHASVASVVDLIAGGLEGLDALHTAVDEKTGRPLDIVHRDLSPKNLMVGEDGHMRLIDLGLGKSNAQDWRTRTGVVMGSVGYMPPEQARGERVDARADVYAMGVVAFEMLALRNYVKRGTISQMMEASAAPTFVRPSEFRPDVPRELDAVIAKALRPDRDQRFGSARAFLEALREVVPPSFTEGGMSALLEELFGDARQIRANKLARLIQAPAPDAFESGPTKVFVMRKGVEPIDQASTKVVGTAGPSGDATALTELSARGPSTGLRSGSHAPVMHPTGLPRTLPDTPSHMEPRGRGISVGMLILAVVGAAAVSGVVSVFVVLAVLDKTPVATAPAVTIPTAPPAPKAPTVTERAAPAAAVRTAAPDPAPAPRKKAPRRAPRRTEPRLAEAPPAPPPPATDPNADLDAALDRLAARARRASASSSSDATKAEARKILIDIAQWRRSTDLGRKRAAVRGLAARLERL